MAVRVEPQSSTKWWVLLAAIGATLLTWWQVASEERRAPAPRAPAEDVVELDVHFESGASVDQTAAPSQR